VHVKKKQKPKQMKHGQTKTKTKRNNKKQTPNKGTPKTKNILASKTNHPK
jgi:hypothetical protein